MRRSNICGLLFCHLVVIFSLCPALFEILIAQQQQQQQHVSNARHSHCEFGTLFLFSCSFVSFQASRRLLKEGKQKRLFTPLLSRRDLEGGSVLSTAILFKRAVIHTSPPPIGSGLCLCARPERERGETAESSPGSRVEMEMAHFNSVCSLYRGQPGAAVTCERSRLGTPSQGLAEGCNPITLHGSFEL